MRVSFNLLCALFSDPDTTAIANFNEDRISADRAEATGTIFASVHFRQPPGVIYACGGGV